MNKKLLLLIALLCLVCGRVNAETITFSPNNNYKVTGNDGVTFTIQQNNGKNISFEEKTNGLFGLGAHDARFRMRDSGEAKVYWSSIPDGYDIRVTGFSIKFAMGDKDHGCSIKTSYNGNGISMASKTNSTVTYELTQEYIPQNGFDKDGYVVIMNGGANYFYIYSMSITYYLVQKVNMSVSAGKYGTFCAPFDFGKHGVDAYTVSYVNKTVLQLDEVDGNNIPVNTPVVIYNSTGNDVNVDEWGAPATRDTCEEGLLVGLLKAVDVPANSYILKTLEGGQKFYKLTTTSTGKANRCYLKEGNYSSAKLLSFDDEEATDISAIDALNYGADIYNANGVKINSLQKGMNIVKMANGSIKKIFVK